MKYGFANFWKEGTSALGQKQTLQHLQPMSTLPPKADICAACWCCRPGILAPKVSLHECVVISTLPILQTMASAVTEIMCRREAHGNNR